MEETIEKVVEEVTAIDEKQDKALSKMIAKDIEFEIKPWGGDGQHIRVEINNEPVRFFRDIGNQIPRLQEVPVGYSKGELVIIAADLLEQVKLHKTATGISKDVKPMKGFAKGNYTRLNNTLKVYLPDK